MHLLSFFCYLIFSTKKKLLYIQTEARLQTSCDSCIGESQLFAGRAAMASPMILIIISDLRWPSQSVSATQPLPPPVAFFPPIRFGWLPGNAACLSAINAAFESSTELENAAGSPEAKSLFDVRDVHGGKIQQNWKVLMGWEAAEAPSICLSEGGDWRMRWRGVRANQELAFRPR